MIGESSASEIFYEPQVMISQHDESVLFPTLMQNSSPMGELPTKNVALQNCGKDPDEDKKSVRAATVSRTCLWYVRAVVLEWLGHFFMWRGLNLMQSNAMVLLTRY